MFIQMEPSQMATTLRHLTHILPPTHVDPLDLIMKTPLLKKEQNTGPEMTTSRKLILALASRRFNWVLKDISN